MPSSVFVQGNSGSGFGTSLAVAFLSNTTAGNALLYGSFGHSASSSVTDTAGTPSLAKTQDDVGNSIYNSLYYRENCAGGACTFTRNHSSDDAGAIVVEYNTIIATGSALDKTAGAGGFSASADSGATAAIAQADEVLIGCNAFESSGAGVTATGGFTEDVELAAPRGGQLQSRLVNAVAAYNSTATLGGSSNWTAIIATFKAVPPPPPIPVRVGTQAFFNAQRRVFPPGA